MARTDALAVESNRRSPEDWPAEQWREYELEQLRGEWWRIEQDKRQMENELALARYTAHCTDATGAERREAEELLRHAGGAWDADRQQMEIEAAAERLKARPLRTDHRPPVPTCTRQARPRTARPRERQAAASRSSSSSGDDGDSSDSDGEGPHVDRRWRGRSA